MQQMETNDEYDKEFCLLAFEIESRYDVLNKHTRLKIEAWLKKLCQVTNNKEWKKNRNLHAICILDMILNNNFEPPYSKFPPDGPIAIISKSLVKAKLSKKFYEMAGNSEYNDIKDNIHEDDKKSTLMRRIKNEEDELDKLKELIGQLRSEVKYKDDIIKRQNEEKKKMDSKIRELESIIVILIYYRNTPFYQGLIKNENYFLIIIY